MIVSDRDLRALLPQLAVEAAHPDYPFDPESQIQPCSLDLRLDNVFWLPRRRSRIDLRRARLLEVQPRYHYKRIELSPGQSIVVRPGRLLLGRLYEQFTVPDEYSAEILGRSSFARLGLQIHCTGGFINPGWRGHMPLQLVNLSPTPIRLVPYLPVCQLRLFRLSSLPERSYGQEELQSKYMEDDGGPSYWWRDKRIRQLHDKLGHVDLALSTQQQILSLIGGQEPEVIERLERLINRMQLQKLDNADSVLERFAKEEERRQLSRRILISGGRATFPLLLGVSLGSLFALPFGFWHYILWGGAGISLPLSLYSLTRNVGEHFARKELEQVQRHKG